jgi:5-dehydro-2-deoxygluconokinase
MEKLYILPFDHRSNFRKFFGEDAEKIKDYKHLIYEGILWAITHGAPKEAVGVLVDEEYGSKILTEAKTDGLRRILTLEKSGVPELELEGGNKFAERLDKWNPEYGKVLISYSPNDNSAKNFRVKEKLKMVSEACATRNIKFLLEVLVIKTEADSDVSAEAFETHLRPELIRTTIREFYAEGIEPQIWKIEGIDDPIELSEVALVVQSGNRLDRGLVILGRDENKERVENWLRVGATVRGVVGFAVGRTIFKEPLLKHDNQEATRAETVAEIGRRYLEYIKIFEVRACKE